MFRLARLTRHVVGAVVAGVVLFGLVPAAAQASVLPAVAAALPALGSPSVVSGSQAPSAAGVFTSLPPARVLDTRSNLGGAGPVPAGGVVHLGVLGRGGVPASGVSSVVLNVTVVYPKSSGYVTVWPDGTPRPTASNLNFVANQTVPNLVAVKVGADGAVALANSSGGTVQLLADVAGYYLSGSPSAAGAFVSLAPARVLDTRSNLGGPGPVPAGGVVHLGVLGRGGVPSSGVSAVVLNVTVVYPKASGYVTVWPDGAPRPTASNLNFVANQTVPNLVVAKVGADGAVALANSSGDTVQLLADVAGYYLAGAPAVAGAFASLAPARLLDTRSNLGAPGPVASGGVVHLSVLGRGGVPASQVSAVVLDVTEAYTQTSGYVTIWPDGTTRPTVSNLNFVAGQTVSNLVVANVGADGAVSLANSSGGAIHLLADVAGYYLSGPPMVTAANAATASATSMALSWTNPTTGPFTGVVIRRATGTTPPATSADGSPVTSTSGATTTYTDTGLSAGTTYSYALFGTDGTTFGPPATMTVTAGSLTWGVPSTVDRNTGHLTSLSCPTTTFCAAVDQFGMGVFFNGTSWSAPTITGPGLHLRSVSCPTTSLCVAVAQGGAALRFDPAQWGALSNIDPNIDLTAVSCPTTSFCAAVDVVGNAFTFNGSTWTSVGDIDGGNQLTSVSCPSESFCVAVDARGDAVTFNGTAWSTPRGVDGSHVLTSVSCPSASFCAAVDNAANGVTYDGMSWSSPTHIDNIGPLLASVSCPTTSSCTAVDSSGHAVSLTGSGWSSAASIDPHGIVAISCPSTLFCAGVDSQGGEVTFDGATWSGVTTVDPYSGYLTGVSCPSASFCAAVDDSGNALSFNGSTWSAPTRIGSGWTSVSCPSMTFCAAVDSHGRASTFDGRAWTSPQTVITPGDLRSVSCPSASFCVATASTGGAVTFNGSTWGAPAYIDGMKPLMSVSCPSSAFCAAVDTSGNVVTFNGSAWGSATAIDAPTSLVTVSCVSASFCVAGDMAGNVLTFDGSSWSGPQSVTTNPIASVSCPTASSCTAIDQYGNALAFNGSTWSAPRHTTYLDGLNSISCPSVVFCAVVEPGDSSAFLGTTP